MIRLALALGLGQAGFHAFIASLPLAMVAVGRDNGEIGAIMGSSALFSLVAALLSGGLIDRFGGRLVFLGGAACFAAAGSLLAAGLVTVGGATPHLLLVRLLQGVGMAACFPAVLSLVPTLVAKRRLPTALAFVGLAANVSLAIVPPLSLVVLSQASLSVLAAITIVAVVGAAVAIWSVRPIATSGPPSVDVTEILEDESPRGGPQQAAAATGRPPAVRPTGRPRTTEVATVGARLRSLPGAIRPKWRSSWGAPLAITLLFLAHWGVITGYLPQRAQAAGADVGLFFTGDAVALLALRIPGGYLAGRFGSLWLLLGGLAVTAAAVTLLLLPPTTLLLIIAGIGTGGGGALILPTLMLELSHRSDETDRGSAFGLYSVAFSLGIALGSIAVAPFIDRVGFEVALGVGIAAFAAAAVICLADRSLRGPAAGRGRDGPMGTEAPA